MAYERDTDRHLRGVGAIASRDAIDPRRAAIRAARARATNARDRQLSQITYQERGGMGRHAMGAISQPLVGGGSGVWAGPPNDRLLNKVYSGAGGMGIGPVQSPPHPPPYMEPPVAAPSPPIMRPPTPAPAPPAPPPSDIGVMVGSPPAQMPPLPAVVVPTLQPGPTLDDSGPPWLLIGAVGVAAYLLFFSDSSGT
jgi:hypothetical protein